MKNIKELNKDEEDALRLYYFEKNANKSIRENWMLIHLIDETMSFNTDHDLIEKLEHCKYDLRKIKEKNEGVVLEEGGINKVFKINYELLELLTNSLNLGKEELLKLYPENNLLIVIEKYENWSDFFNSVESINLIKIRAYDYWISFFRKILMTMKV